VYVYWWYKNMLFQRKCHQKRKNQEDQKIIAILKNGTICIDKTHFPNHITVFTFLFSFGTLHLQKWKVTKPPGAFCQKAHKSKMTGDWVSSHLCTNSLNISLLWGHMKFIHRICLSPRATNEATFTCLYNTKHKLSWC